MKIEIKLYILFSLNFYYLIIIKNETCSLEPYLKDVTLMSCEILQFYIICINIVYFTCIVLYTHSCTDKSLLADELSVAS